MTTIPNYLNHSTWECKYHVVFTPKYRKKVLYGLIRKELKEVFHRLARQKVPSRSCKRLWICRAKTFLNHPFSMVFLRYQMRCWGPQWLMLGMLAVYQKKSICSIQLYDFIIIYDYLLFIIFIYCCCCAYECLIAPNPLFVQSPRQKERL